MDEDVVAVFIPIVAIIMSLSIPIVYAIVDYRRRRDIVEAHHKERLAAIEKGLDIPPEPVEPENGKKSSALRSGLIGLFVGVVLYFALAEVAGSDIALFGLIPAAVGIANLLAWFLEGRKANGGGKSVRE